MDSDKGYSSSVTVGIPRRGGGMPEYTTALLAEATLIPSGFKFNSPVSPRDFDRLVSAYRLT